MGKEETKTNEEKQFKIAILFADEMANGKTREKAVSFAVEAETIEEAKKTLRRWLAKCVEHLDESESSRRQNP